MNEADNSAVTKVLGPLDAADFFARHWEQSPLHISRNDANHFADLLSIEQLETLFSTQELFYPSVQLSRKADPVAPADYTDSAEQIVPLRLIEHFHDGATIVLSQGHRHLAGLAEFKRQLQVAWDLQCQANVYLSPPGKQGFNAHYDSHDVFILQVQGSKTFNFYNGGVELPYSHDGFRAEHHKAGDLTERIEMQPGDTLYIPRGVMHDAVARDDASLHITLGVYAVTLRDVLTQMVDILTEEDPRYRRSLLPGVWRKAVEGSARSASETSAKTEADALLQLDARSSTSPIPPQVRQALLELSLTDAHLQAAMTRLVDEVAIGGAQNCTGRLSIPAPKLTPDTVVHVKPGRARHVERIGSTVRYRTSGQVLEFTGPMGVVVEKLLLQGALALHEFDNLDDEQSKALTARLLQANIVEIQ